MDRNSSGFDADFYRKAEGKSKSPSSYDYEGHNLASDAPKNDRRQTTDSIDWEASEYIHHSKGAAWVFGLVLVTVVLVGLAIWMQVWTFAVLIVIMSVAIGVFAFRKPNVLRYKLNHDGIQIDDKFYDLDDFRAFGILSDGAFYTIVLLPTKRFMPAVNVYFAEEQGEKIVDILGENLPVEKLEMDILERMMRRLRF